MHFFISFNFHLKYFSLQIIILTINVSKLNEIPCIYIVFQIHNIFEFIFKFKSIRA